MSKCSKKCNDIKNKIDSISGLDDDFIYSILNEIESQIDWFVHLIDVYEKQDKLNGTIFKKFQ